MSGRGRRGAARTTVAVAILLGVAWWVGRAAGQHRRARRQLSAEPTAYTFTVRPTPQELTA